MISEIIESIIMLFVRFLQAVVIVAWSGMALIVLIVIGYHVVNVFKSVF
jgi:hypothetical protein